MYIDNENVFSDEQAVTASAASTNVVDFGKAGGGDGLKVVILVPTAATAAGDATVTFALQTATDAAFSSPITEVQTDAIAKTALTLGREPIVLTFPHGGQRYGRVYYTVATGPLTAGKFTAAIVGDIQTNRRTF